MEVYRKGQKGFTLIEILVSVAILSIVLFAVATAMVTGSRSFAKGNADAGVQKEAQLAVNQVEDMIIDIKGGVDLQMYAGGALLDLSSVTTKEEMAEKEEQADKKELVLYNAVRTDTGTSYTKEIVGWEKSTENVTYSLWNVNYDSTTDTYETAGSALYQDELLAEHVVSFSIDLSDVKKEQLQDGTEVDVLRSVQITAGCRSGNNMVSYATSPLITLRNRLVKSGDPDVIFDPPQDETEPFSLYISGASDTFYLAVPIIDRVTEVECDKMYNIYAMINLGGTINDSVDFSIEEDCQSSINSNGVLSVGELESNEYLTIVATHKDDTRRVARGVVKVLGKSGKRLVAAHIIPVRLPAFNPQYQSVVETENFEEQDLNALQYTWTVSTPEYFEPFDGSGEKLNLRVDQTNEAVYGKTVSIKLSVYSPTTHQTVTDVVSYTIDAKGNTGDSFAVRGGQYGFSYETNSQARLIYYFCDEYGNKVEDQTYLDMVEIDPYWGSFNLRLNKDLPWDRNFYLRIQAFDDNELSVYDKVLPINSVKMYPYTSTANEHGSFYFYMSSCVHDQVVGSNWQNYFTVSVEEIVTEDGDTSDIEVRQVNNLNTNELHPDNFGLYMMQGQYEIIGNRDKLRKIKFKITAKDPYSLSTITTYSTVVF